MHLVRGAFRRGRAPALASAAFSFLRRLICRDRPSLLLHSHTVLPGVGVCTKHFAQTQDSSQVSSSDRVSFPRMIPCQRRLTLLPLRRPRLGLISPPPLSANVALRLPRCAWCRNWGSLSLPSLSLSLSLSCPRSLPPRETSHGLLHSMMIVYGSQPILDHCKPITMSHFLFFVLAYPPMSV